ncbi:hypothetical protein ES332_D12G084700v1 [Gossypium tomentosum]|uniref:Uncharacterized protein n=1 Tax=Gossypium tomentosum TaxID=34277 RepID=A0A5D2I699_GOSTO|nr:hypothetical protein ES332_D12G084700v1 [Gossypium tomentosum]
MGLKKQHRHLLHASTILFTANQVGPPTTGSTPGWTSSTQKTLSLRRSLQESREIAFPSSLPGPPHIKKRRKLTWHERFLVLKEASRLYAASWKDDGTEGKSNGDKSRSTEIEPLTLDDIDHGDALKSFIEGYRDALKSFMEGYQEVIQQIMEKKEYSSTAQQEGNTDKNST